ncbi:hypothetical protein F4819DRAFT_477071 [Hypoxylon fuscum]|nr:hypothetical protein F4819DRAFT_477071 [Hypoxylon fuscum]
MDPIRAPRISATGGRLNVTRHPALALAAVAATGIAATVLYKRTALSRNEKAQKNSFYVSVDRSGGGI